jgi:hypothetical protein
VLRHRRDDRLEGRQLISWNQLLDRARLARHSPDESKVRELDDHLVTCGGRHAGGALEVSLCGCLAVERRCG